MTEEQENKNKSSWIKFFQENWSWVTPLTYIYVSYVGIVVSWAQFRNFGINIVEFSEINDFLLAAFREPLSLILVLMIIIVLYIYVSWIQSYLLNLHNSLKKVRSKAAKSYGEKSSFAKIGSLFSRNLSLVNIPVEGIFRSRSLKNILIVSYALGAPFLVAEYYNNLGTKRILNDSNRHVNVVLVDRGNTESSPKTYIFLGTTDNYVFFYDKLQEKSTVVPFVNIQRIEHKFSTNLRQSKKLAPR